MRLCTVVVLLLLILNTWQAPGAAADSTAQLSDGSNLGDAAGEERAPAEPQHIPWHAQLFDSTHWQLLLHAGRKLLEGNFTQSSNSSSFGSVPSLDTSTAAGETSAGNSTSNSTALAVMDKVVQEAFVAAAGALNFTNISPAWIRYYRIKTTRILMVLSEAAELVYAVAGCAQRAFALMVPIIKVGQTGQLVINATSFLTLAQLVADFVARFGDVFCKAFFLAFRGIILATTLPPAA